MFRQKLQFLFNDTYKAIYILRIVEEITTLRISKIFF